MLMMQDKEVHFHVIPRHSKEINMFGIIWSDISWPDLPILSTEVLAIDKLKIIRSYIDDKLKN